MKEEAECMRRVPILVASLLQSGVHAVSALCCALHSWQGSLMNKTSWWVQLLNMICKKIGAEHGLMNRLKNEFEDLLPNRLI